MPDVLSQNEIDELLAALSTGEVDVSEIEEEKKEKKVRKYDFSRPDKFAKDQLRTLEIIHENFSRLLNNFLSGYLRTYIEVDVISVQSLIYTEFSNSISNPAILGIVDFAPFDGQVIIDVSADIANAMIERVLGGTGKASGMSSKESRSLTEIEMTLLRNILIKFINLLKEPWGNIVELRPKLENIETNAQFAQIVSPAESVALITFNLHIGENEGMINICIPHFVIEPILPSLSSRLWFATSNKKEVTDEEREALETGISRSRLNMTAVVGGSNITVSELLNLQKGDIILLNKNVEEPLDIYVENQLKYKAKPGIKKKNVAIMISEIIEEGDELDE
ncbi:flagellar motor switch protein FliM [Fusibacter bizertensis]|jgi:flagellar motor switch protein FliM|uniref:Flagellar motor switch protein FliM n=1 Tax=Fusibacter bizertensis TaxID=1488331 RepID=A0ABT6N890_9FIRM|nr:flagellar motor switch protein FliM [Fusibacter bizertensis]MDH8676621.1 flagellar motor switch protein FliM [Fusibacter bizertensis]